MANKVQRTEPGQSLHSHAGTSLLERTYPGPLRLALTFLEINEICRVALCSSTLKVHTEAPRLWEIVSHTLELPDYLWVVQEKRSKKDVSMKLQGLRIANNHLRYCCRTDTPRGPDGETLRDKVLKFSKEPDLDGRISRGARFGNARLQFLNETRPIVQAMCKSAVPSAALHEMLMCQQENADRILTLFFACGHRGTPRTLNYITGFPLYCPRIRDGERLPDGRDATLLRDLFVVQPAVIHTHANRLGTMLQCAEASDARLNTLALDFLLQWGELPETYTPLLVEYRKRPDPKVANFIGYWMKKGSKFPNGTLYNYLCAGPLEHVKLFLETTNCEVSPTDLSLFLHRYAQSIISNVLHDASYPKLPTEHILDLINLMLAKQPDVRDYHTVDPGYSDIFARMALAAVSKRILEKLVSIGMKPLNDPDPSSNSLALTFTTQIQLSYEEIENMVACGAQPPNNYKELIAKKYDDQPQEREQLLKLFAK